ncbi:MAG TPA: NYN domain-containing protein [Polyangia bacterium]|nr:NYN domain-containing protein [Polyangia bacterium]
MRVAIFIDGAYLDNVLRNHHGGIQIAYDKLSIELCEAHEHVRTYYYDAPPYQSDPPTPEESKRFAGRQSFFSALRKLPRFDVREGRCQRNWDKTRNTWQYTQKRVDVFLAVDLVRLATKALIQRAVIVTGDSDFLPPISIAKDEGVQVKVVHSPDIKQIHRDLWDHADERAPLDAAMIAKIKR